MTKLLFDPITYHFYCPRGSENPAAKAAGFDWDPLRLRYYTEDPKVAVQLANHGSNYVNRLLADALDTAPLGKTTAARVSSRRSPGPTRVSLPSTSVH
jgi:hypothetical protein